MCDTCGCSSKDPATMTVLESGSATAKLSTAVDVLENEKRLHLSESLLSANDKVAEHNREHFARQSITALNLVSAPGSGKTTLLENTLLALKGDIACAVIEGDQATLNDAQRIRATGCQVVQVNTGSGCHLEANMVHTACHQLNLQDGSLLFIENVGNLVCPSLFDLGEALKVALISVTEGDDKPLKYPHIFRASEWVLINKCDLLPYVNFDIAQCREHILALNPQAKILEITATDQGSLQPWLEMLQALHATS